MGYDAGGPYPNLYFFLLAVTLFVPGLAAGVSIWSMKGSLVKATGTPSQ